jgi:hypothetical protein
MSKESNSTTASTECSEPEPDPFDIHQHQPSEKGTPLWMDSYSSRTVSKITDQQRSEAPASATTPMAKSEEPAAAKKQQQPSQKCTPRSHQGTPRSHTSTPLGKIDYALETPSLCKTASTVPKAQEPTQTMEPPAQKTQQCADSESNYVIIRGVPQKLSGRKRLVTQGQSAVEWITGEKKLASAAAIVDSKETNINAGNDQPPHTGTSALRRVVTATLAVSYKTVLGQQVRVVGNLPVLGGWDPMSAVTLEWTEGHIWVMPVDLEFPSDGTPIEYKYVVTCSGKPHLWEEGDNRILAPEDCGPTYAWLNFWGSPSKRLPIPNHVKLLTTVDEENLNEDEAPCHFTM